MSDKCVSKNYSIPVSMIQAIKDHAKKSGLKESTIVQQAITSYLQGSKKKGNDS